MPENAQNQPSLNWSRLCKSFSEIKFFDLLTLIDLLHLRHMKRNGLIGHTLMLNDDIMAAFGFSEIFTTRKVPGSRSEVPTKMIAEQ